MSKGRIIILSAPSGGGKTSLARALIDRNPGLVFSVSHTTRPLRPGEIEGVHYHFVDEKQFNAMAAQGEFLEHARVFDSQYGTSRAALERELGQGRDVILDIDWQGARAVKARQPEAVSIFILPPSRAALEARLRERRQDSTQSIERRMHAAVSEMRHYDEFDYVVVNDEFSAALTDLEAIINRNLPNLRPFKLNVATLLHD